MSTNKTKPTTVAVDEFLAELDEKRRAESYQLIEIMKSVSKEPPVMWGASIVGFGNVHYKYLSGREGDTMNIGFSPRKAKISLYMTYDASKYKKQLDDMGKHTTGKGCVYVNKLEDIDLSKLKDLLEIIYRSDNKYEASEQ